MSRPSIVINLVLGLLWTISHLALGLLNLWAHLIYSLECYFISSELLRKYQNLHLNRLKYLAIVVESKEAKSTVKVKQLLCRLSSMGVKYVGVYDIDGKTMSSAFEFAGLGFTSIRYNVSALRSKHFFLENRLTCQYSSIYIDPEFETDPKMEGVNNIVLNFVHILQGER